VNIFDAFTQPRYFMHTGHSIISYRMLRSKTRMQQTCESVQSILFLISSPFWCKHGDVIMATRRLNVNA